jgi:hypothetical protein
MEGKNLFANLSNIRETLHRFIETRFLYYKLILFEKSARVITAVISSVVVAILVFIALLFFSAALGFWIGTMLESYELGMVIVGGIYLLLGLLLFSLRTKIFSPPVIKSLAKSFFEQEDDNDDVNEK